MTKPKLALAKAAKLKTEKDAEDFLKALGIDSGDRAALEFNPNHDKLGRFKAGGKLSRTEPDTRKS